MCDLFCQYNALWIQKYKDNVGYIPASSWRIAEVSTPSSTSAC